MAEPGSPGISPVSASPVSPVHVNRASTPKMPTVTPRKHRHLNNHFKRIDREYQTTPMRVYLRHVMESTVAGYVLDISSVVLSMGAVVLYVASTYQAESGPAMEIADMAIACIFLVEFLFRLYIARSRRAFLFSWFSVVDILTIVPPFLELFVPSSSSSTSLMFLRAVRVMKILRILQLSRLIKHSDNEVSRALTTMAFTIVVLIFCSACFFMEVEMDPDDPELRMYTFHQSMYWSVVTASTLGYGDISPYTTLGQWLVVIMMILMFSVIPYQTNKVLELIAQGNQYLRKRYHRRQRKLHVVIMGYISGEGMQDVIDELYHEDHGFLENDIVFLSDQPPDRKMQNILLTHSKTDQLHFLEGQMKDAKDLDRAKVHKAQMVFIMANRDAVDAAEEDTQNIMTALAVDKFIQECCRGGDLRNMPSINRCLVQLLLPTSRQHLVSAIRACDDGNRVPHAVSIVCLNDVSAQMIGLSANNCPGLSTLLLNLCRSSTHYLPLGVHASPWHYEYWWGVGMEIYQCPLSPYFQGMTFRKVAGILYSNLQVVLIGIQKDARVSRGPTRRHGSPRKKPAVMTRVAGEDALLDEELLLGPPMDYVVADPTTVSVYVICNHARCALSVASYGLEKDGEVAAEASPNGKAAATTAAVQVPNPFAGVGNALSELSRIEHGDYAAPERTSKVLSALDREFTFKKIGSSVGSMINVHRRAPTRNSSSGLIRLNSDAALSRAETPRLSEAVEAAPPAGMVEVHARLSLPKACVSRFHPARDDEEPPQPHHTVPQQRRGRRSARLDCGIGGLVKQLARHRHKEQVSDAYTITGISNKHMFAVVDFHDLDADDSLANLALTPGGTTPRVQTRSPSEGATPSLRRSISGRHMSAVRVLLNPSEVTQCNTDSEEGEEEEMDASLMLTSSSKRRALKEAYHTRSAPWSIHASTLRSVEFSGHFLIIGWSYPAVVLLVASLRRRYLKSIRPIVIMDAKRPLENWESVSIYQAVYFMAGQSTDFDDLLRAHANKANYVLLLPPNVEGPTWNSRQGPRKDTLVVLAHQHLKYLAPNVPVLTELTEGMNQTFLSNTPLCGSSLSYQLLAVSYASGTVFLPNMLDALCIQAFFNPCILRIVKLLLTSHLDILEDEPLSPGRSDSAPLPPITGSPAEQRGSQTSDRPSASNFAVDTTADSLHDITASQEQWPKASSIMTQIPVPEHMVGAEYGKLVRHLLDDMDMIAIGLYRAARNQVLCNEMPFVYTNPPTDAIVNSGDRVFVLSSRLQDEPIGCDSELLSRGQEAVPKASSRSGRQQQHELQRRHSAPPNSLGGVARAPAASGVSLDSKQAEFRGSGPGDQAAPAAFSVPEGSVFTPSKAPVEDLQPDGQLLETLTRQQHKSQKALMAQIQFMFDRMHGDIKEVRQELNEVRQAQKHTRGRYVP